jgi:hypothetical protein
MLANFSGFDLSTTNRAGMELPKMSTSTSQKILGLAFQSSMLAGMSANYTRLYKICMYVCNLFLFSLT